MLRARLGTPRPVLRSVVRPVALPVITGRRFYDPFNRADENLEDSPPWTRLDGVEGAAAISSNRIETASVGSTDTPYLCPALGSADHYSRCTMLAAYMSTSGVLAVRVTDGNNYVGVRAVASGTTWELLKKVGGNFTTLSTGGTYTSGDTVEVQAVGNHARVLVNGVQAIGWTSLAGSQSGVARQGIVVRGSAVDPWMDNFAAGVL